MNLVESGDIRRLNQVRMDFEELMRAHRREVDVTLITGKPLSPAALAQMQKSIQADYLQPQDNLIFTASVDSSVKGGYKVIIKGQEHDLTWNHAIDEAESQVRVVHAARVETALRNTPRPPTLNLADAVKDIQNDKEVGEAFGASLFARTLAAFEKDRSALEAALAAAPAALTL